MLTLILLGIGFLYIIICCIRLNNNEKKELARKQYWERL